MSNRDILTNPRNMSCNWGVETKGDKGEQLFFNKLFVCYDSYLYEI